jgi:hypothetical protein
MGRAYGVLQGDSASAAREAATAALQIAQAKKEPLLEAEAHLCLANSDRMMSRIRRAQISSQRAAFLFQLGGDGTKTWSIKSGPCIKGVSYQPCAAGVLRDQPVTHTRFL